MILLRTCATDWTPKRLARLLANGLAGLVLVCLLWGGAWSQSVDSDALKPVTFLPQWQPQAQFAGYYIAKQQGIYAQHGLDVTILRGGPNHPALAGLKSGEADFTSAFLSNGVREFAGGTPLVHLAQLVQQSSLMLVAKADSGIDEIEDLDGRRVSIWPSFDIQPRALFRQHGIEPEIIPQNNTLNLFLRGAVDAASAMWYNEYYLLINSGLEESDLVEFFLRDSDVNFPEDGIYTLRSTWEADEAMCLAFVQATLEGWRYAFAHPEEALDAVMDKIRRANLASNRVHQRWMLARMQDIMMPEGDAQPLGTLDAQALQRVSRELQNFNMIEEPVLYERFHQNCTE